MYGRTFLTQSPIRAAVQGAYEAVTAASYKLPLMENGGTCVLMRTLNLSSALDLTPSQKVFQEFPVHKLGCLDFVPSPYSTKTFLSKCCVHTPVCTDLKGCFSWGRLLRDGSEWTAPKPQCARCVPSAASLQACASVCY